MGPQVSMYCCCHRETVMEALTELDFQIGAYKVNSSKKVQQLWQENWYPQVFQKYQLELRKDITMNSAAKRTRIVLPFVCTIIAGHCSNHAECAKRAMTILCKEWDSEQMFQQNENWSYKKVASWTFQFLRACMIDILLTKNVKCQMPNAVIWWKNDVFHNCR